MRFQYRLTDREYLHRLKLSGIPVWGAWRAYAVVTLALVPSVVLFAYLGARSSLLGFQCMVGFMVMATVSAYFQKKGYPGRFTESLELDENQLRHTFGSSRSEWNWCRIDHVEDRKDAILFYSLGRPLYIPKRVLFGQLEAVNATIKQGRESVVDETDISPVTIYGELIERDNPSNRNTYRVTEDDLQLALSEHFQRVSLPILHRPQSIPLSQTKPYSKTVAVLNGLAIAVLLGVSLTIAYILLTLSGDGWIFQAIQRRLNNVQFLLVVVGWLLPVILIWSWSKLLPKARVRALKQKLVDEDSLLTLNPEGWVIANPACGTFGSWRDVTDVLYSNHFFAFKMINQLAYLIPKRIFPTPEAANQFLQTAIDFITHSRPRSQELDSEFVSVEAIETSNPYQSPQQ